MQHRALRLVTLSLLLGASAALPGCALNFRLLEDGKLHRGSFDVASGTMQVVIDGDIYRGPIARGAPSVGFMSGSAGTRFATGTIVMASNQFTGVLTNAAGKVLRCQFQSALGSGQGICQNNDGRTFDFVQGGE